MFNRLNAHEVDMVYKAFNPSFYRELTIFLSQSKHEKQ
jgi:hypothetical protein